MTVYKIKGKDDVRQVFDGTLLIGTIHRSERPIITTSYECDRTTGKIISISVKKKIEVRWKAMHADGTKVCHSDGRRVITYQMKAWSEPDRWVRYSQEDES